MRTYPSASILALRAHPETCVHHRRALAPHLVPDAAQPLALFTVCSGVTHLMSALTHVWPDSHGLEKLDHLGIVATIIGTPMSCLMARHSNLSGVVVNARDSCSGARQRLGPPRMRQSKCRPVGDTVPAARSSANCTTCSSTWFYARVSGSI